MPARSTFDGDVTVYRYRCPLEARNVPDAALAQMRMAHDLRNELVAVEHQHAKRVAEVWAAHPEVGQSMEDVEAADEVVKTLIDRAKKERILDESKTPRSDTRRELAAARIVLKEARARLRAARDGAYPVLRPAMAEVQAIRKAEIMAASRQAKAAGLLWHTNDAVLAAHDVTSRKIASARAAGRAADFHFKRWTGNGRLRVTLTRNEWQHGCPRKSCGRSTNDCPQRKPQHPLRSPALLASGQGPWRNVAILAPHMDPEAWETQPLRPAARHHGERQTITVRVGSRPDRSPIMWTIPVFVTRPLPADSDIAYIEIIRTTIAGNSRVSVCITARIPPTPQRISGNALGVNLGWRSVEGGIRVGVIASTAQLPLVPPQPELANVIRMMADGRHAEIVAPDDWRQVWTNSANIRSIRDMALDITRRKVVDALNEGVEGIDTPAHEVARWRSFARFAGLTRVWPSDHPLAEALEAWRRQDRHLWEIESHGRDQVVARRRDAWNKVGAWLFNSDVALLAIPDAAIADLIKVPKVDDGDDRQAELARAQHQVAAPGALAFALRQAAVKRGVQVVVPKSAGASRTHLTCGHELADPDDTRDSVMVWCSACQIAYDQDVNAADTAIVRSLGDLAATASPAE